MFNTRQIFKILFTCLRIFRRDKDFWRISAEHMSFWRPYCADDVCDVPIVSAAVA